MLKAMIVVAAAAGIALPVQAAENFVPKGHLYTAEEPSLPELNSDADQVNNETDVYETQLYVLKRERKILDSQMNRFFSDQELSGGDFSPDY